MSIQTEAIKIDDGLYYHAGESLLVFEMSSTSPTKLVAKRVKARTTLSMVCECNSWREIDRQLAKLKGPRKMGVYLSNRRASRGGN